MLYLDKYKVVILNEPRKPSIGERITSSASPGKAMKTWLDWKPREDISVTVNLIEILELVGFLVMLFTRNTHKWVDIILKRRFLFYE